MDLIADRGTWKRVVPPFLIILFAAGVLQFGWVANWAAPQSERVNDGKTPTFFAFHISPYFNFSEDFHLYITRAKRIADRGWKGNLFWTTDDDPGNYALPLQVSLAQIAILTDGNVLPYSIFMFGVLAIAWTVLYMAARAWLPNANVWSIVLAVLVTVLVESIHYLYCDTEFETYDQWPLFRGLRMATMAWSSPLLVASLLGSAYFLLNTFHSFRSLISYCLVLVLLAAGDNWAFAMAWCGAIAALGGRCLWVTGQCLLRRSFDWQSIRQNVLLALSVALPYLFHRACGGEALEGDALERAGFGEIWHTDQRMIGNLPFFSKWVWTQAIISLTLVILGFLYLSFVAVARRGIGTSRSSSQSIVTSIWTFALLTLWSMFAVETALKPDGMEFFLRHQLFWRGNYCLLFAVIVAILEMARLLVDRLAKVLYQGGHGKTWAIGCLTALSCLIIYHNYRIHRFAVDVVAKDFFLTADAEEFRDWLAKYESKNPEFVLATASPELNYLAAYWSNADLLLPSGFPLHDISTNEEIRERVIYLLKLYNTTRKSWMDFNRAIKGGSQEIWRTSRSQAAGATYLYHLYHRLNGHSVEPTRFIWKTNERNRIGSTLNRKGKLVLTNHSQLAQPDVIVVDTVSRALGDPDLSRYRLAFKSNTIEAWVRRSIKKDAATSAASSPLSTKTR